MSDLQPEAPEAAATALESQAPVNEADTGPEAPESVVSVAEAMGWAPRDKWRGKPDGWVDASTFLKQQPARLKRLSDQVETVAKTADRMFADGRKRMEREIRTELAAATEAGDHEAVQDAAERLADVRAPKADPGEIQRQFAKDNPWFGKNRAATALAKEAAGEIAAQGISDPARQLEAAEKAVREEFPDLFDDESPEDRPSRSSPSKAAPHVQGGQRAAQGQPREKGWADLPASVRSTMTDRRLTSWGFTADAAGRAEYAKIYLKEQEGR